MTAPSERRFTNGRIRLTKEQALDLRLILEREKARLFEARGDLLDYEVRDGIRIYNKLLVRVKEMQQELERTIREQGWDSVENEGDGVDQD